MNLNVGPLVSQPAGALPLSPVPPEIFKAYDIRGLYGEQIGGDVAYQVGRAFARVLGRLAGKEPRALRIGLGRDMRLPARRLAARYREGMVAEGAEVLDAGMVGTEMLYWLVGSRDLDGGLMCTASHNPKAYTGAKLVERGAVPLSGERGIGDIRALLETRLGPAPGGGCAEDVEIYPDFLRDVMRFIDPAAIRPMKVVLDGGNGMAARMVDPILKGLGLELSRPTGSQTASSPATSPTPCCPRPARSSSAGSGTRAPTSGSRGTATPTAASSSTTQGRSCPATSSPRCSPASCSSARPAATSSTTSARPGRSRTRSRQPGGVRSSTASATRSSRPACATRVPRSAARCQVTTTSGPSTTPTRGRFPRC